MNPFETMSVMVNSGEVVNQGVNTGSANPISRATSAVSNWLDQSFPKDLDSLLSSDPNKLPSTLQDLYWQYILNEKSLNSAYQRELDADSSKYQRLVDDLKKAGINPIFALGGASAGNINSQSASYNTGFETTRYHKASEKLSYEQLKEQKRKNNMDFITSLIRIAASAVMVAAL